MDILDLLIILLLVVIIACCAASIFQQLQAHKFGNCEKCGGAENCEICKGGCESCSGGCCHDSVTGMGEQKRKKNIKKGKDESHLTSEAQSIIKTGDSSAVATYLGSLCAKNDPGLASEVLALRHDIVNIISTAPGLIDYVYSLPHAQNKDIDNVLECIKASLPKRGSYEYQVDTLKDVYGALRLYIMEVGTNAPIEKFLIEKYGKPTKLDMPVDTKGIKHKNLYALVNKIINEKAIKSVAEFVKETGICYENFLPKNKLDIFLLSDDFDIDIITDLTLEIKSKVGDKATIQEVNGLLRKINPSSPMYKFAPGYSKKPKATIKRAKERAFRVDLLGYEPFISAVTDSIKYGQVNKIFEVLVNSRVVPTLNQEREIRLYLSNLGKLRPEEEKISLFIDKNYFIIQRYRQEIEELKRRLAATAESSKSDKLLDKLSKVEKMLEDGKVKETKTELSKVADAAEHMPDLPPISPPSPPPRPPRGPPDDSSPPPRPPRGPPDDSSPPPPRPPREPEISEPEVSEPEISEPEISEPEVSEPEISEPEVSEPEISEPEVSEPEISEPEVSEPPPKPPKVREDEKLLDPFTDLSQLPPPIPPRE